MEDNKKPDVAFIIYDTRLERPIFSQFHMTVAGYDEALTYCKGKNMMARGKGRYQVKAFDFENRKYVNFKPENFGGK